MKVKVDDYPFLHGGVSVPKEKKEDVNSIRAWLKHQPHLPQTLTDAHLMMFLHSNYYSLERTKATIESYYVVRAENADLFTHWTMDELEKSLKVYEFAALPGETPEGYRVLLYRLKDMDASKVFFDKALRAFLAFNDARISEDGLVPGYIVLFDMRGCCLSHLARVSAQVHLLRIFMIYIQECHPVRLKGVHVINTAAFMDRVLSLIKPLMQSELIHLLHLHSSLDTLREFVPLKMMPEDYGGDTKSISYLHDENLKMMKKYYADWLIDSEVWAADLKKKPQKSKTGDGMVGSFRTLQID